MSTFASSRVQVRPLLPPAAPPVSNSAAATPAANAAADAAKSTGETCCAHQRYVGAVSGCAGEGPLASACFPLSLGGIRGNVGGCGAPCSHSRARIEPDARPL